ncbi:hypothetical protein CQW23_31247 [Capsicum baccatum]|uniref:Pentatricopeptide repeat-containing protein, mitochondrial n=1 Tax=Capsicum baccatum TaxID=33114 RepID=A0A2G2V876_CAPBA|nr:hypothetical protein CQW23_31247 [Capsicum baccatum]
MLDREIKPIVVTYNFQTGFLWKSGDVEGGKMLFQDMVRKGNKANAVTYGLLMEGLCCLGKYKEAKKLMFDMKYQGCKTTEAYMMLIDMQITGCYPNTATYRMMVDRFCKTGEFEKGLNVLNAMLMSRHFSRMETVRCLILGLLDKGKVDDAFFVLEEMKMRNKGFDFDSWEVVVKDSCTSDRSASQLLDGLVF